MAVLGKIRQRSLLLISIIGFALFAFIAEELFRSCETTRNEASQRAGEVLGEKLDVQTFNQMVDEYTTAMKVMQQRDDFSADELSNIRDMAWQQYVSNKVIENECEKLGLTVTDKELQNVLAEGTNPMLAQTPFVNQQTGKFDVNTLKNFLGEYEKAKGSNPQAAEQMKSIYTYWKFVEKNLRTQLLQQKYQALLGGCMLANDISVKAQFDAENEESTVELVAIPYTSINDKDVKVEDSDLKAKYEELKPLFRRYEETRDIQYVDYLITPSSADMNALKKDFEGYKAQLEEGKDASEVVRKAGSLVPYNGLAKQQRAYPSDIAALIDSTAVGTTTAAKENKAEGTMNLIKVISKVSLPDSVEFRAIQVVDADAAKIEAKADSVINAIKGGADFETIAKKYGQTGTKQWMTSAMYQNSPSIDEDTKTYLNALLKGETNAIQKIKLTQATLVIQVTDKKAMQDMYDVAVVKKAIQFSKETSTAAFNKFSEYVAKSKNLDDLKKNAKSYGYEVKVAKNVAKTDHNVAGIRSTSETLKWIFNKDTKEGDLYTEHLECGDNGDHLMVVVLDKINKEGYADLSEEDVNNYVKGLALNDKKAEKIMAECKNYEAAKKVKGAKTMEVKQITFASPVFIPEIGAQESALSGAVAATTKGQVSKAPVKGHSGVYMFKVTDKKKLGGKMDKKAIAQKIQQQSLMAAQQFMQELVQKADVKDNRYIFF
ncbi:MAG: SurA N-terminal domain-containing protein [Bacteroidaceae bacterium]|nr:SurA N-terminal domain-containing protein [Bacteroidaceae bacterium]